MAKKRLFGTFGVRRTANDVLTPEFASRLAASYGSLVQGTVAIGGDTRTSTPMLKYAITAGLLSSGCDVVDLGILPTPGVQYAVRKYYDGGVMITASHNPSQYNGIKLWNANGMAYTPEQEKEIEDLYYSEEFGETRWDHIGSIVYNEEIKNQYINDLVNAVDIKPGFKVVIDCACGAGSEISPIAFRKAGCNVITLNSQVDGFFPGRNPEPNAENLQNLMKTVVAIGAELGIAHDGDADRMITVDENGGKLLHSTEIAGYVSCFGEDEKNIYIWFVDGCNVTCEL